LLQLLWLMISRPADRHEHLRREAPFTVAASSCNLSCATSPNYWRLNTSLQRTVTASKSFRLLNDQVITAFLIHVLPETTQQSAIFLSGAPRTGLRRWGESRCHLSRIRGANMWVENAQEPGGVKKCGPEISSIARRRGSNFTFWLLTAPWKNVIQAMFPPV
jgi:hypothetical protein